MAEEGTLGLERSSADRDDDDGTPSKQELQRRMEEARETITQTVTEIKETVTNQYYSMKETVSEALDWRHHFRNNPIAFSVGALSVGFLVGYGLAGTMKGSGGQGRDDYPSAEESDVYARMNARPQRYEDERDSEERHSAFHGHSFAAQPIVDGSSATSDYDRSAAGAGADEGDYGRAAQGGGGTISYIAPRAEREPQEPEKPGLFERFKETPAYDRLQAEVSTLGERFIEELSTTAQTVVLPALFNKLKDLFGVDLSGKQQGRATTESNQEVRQATGPQAENETRAASAAASSASGSLASASRGSSTSSYATSENRGYGASGTTSETDKGGEGSSVLDLDR
jgi:hypothetical protein